MLSEKSAAMATLTASLSEKSAAMATLTASLSAKDVEIQELLLSISTGKALQEEAVNAMMKDLERRDSEIQRLMEKLRVSELELEAMTEKLEKQGAMMQSTYAAECSTTCMLERQLKVKTSECEGYSAALMAVKTDVEGLLRSDDTITCINVDPSLCCPTEAAAAVSVQTPESVGVVSVRDDDWWQPLCDKLRHLKHHDVSTLSALDEALAQVAQQQVVIDELRDTGQQRLEVDERQCCEKCSAWSAGKPWNLGTLEALL
jgi:hypothetical protein